MADVNVSSESWHLSKSINVGHIITTVIVVVSTFSYVSAFDKRLAETEFKVEYLKESQQAQINRTDEKFKELRVDIKEVIKKLDRMIEDKQTQ